MVLAVSFGFEKLVSLSCGLFDFYVLHIGSQCRSFCFPIGGLQPIFCKPHNSRDLSWQCVVRWPLPLGISLTFRIVPLRVQSGRFGHFVLSLGTVRFKQPGMRPTPVPQKKKSDQKKHPPQKKTWPTLAMSTAARSKTPVKKKKSFRVDSGAIAWSRLNVCG